jgi:hypothetical protein
LVPNLELIKSDPADASAEIVFQDIPRYDAGKYKRDLIVLVNECEVRNVYRECCPWRAGFLNVRRGGQLSEA